MKRLILVLCVAFVGCEKKPSLGFDRADHLEHFYLGEFNTILHLKESNYEIGISSPFLSLRRNESWILQACLDDGRILYVKDVKKRVQ